jgi:anti-sigma B factor antagonist
MNEHAGHDASDPVRTTLLRDGVSVVHVAGALDAAACRPVAAELVALLDGHPAGVVVDLRAVDVMGSAGIAALLNARHQAVRSGVPFAVVVDDHRVSRPLRLSQVHDVLAVHPTVDGAVAAVRLEST